MKRYIISALVISAVAAAEISAMWQERGQAPWRQTTGMPMSRSKSSYDFEMGHVYRSRQPRQRPRSAEYTAAYAYPERPSQYRRFKREDLEAYKNLEQSYVPAPTPLLFFEQPEIRGIRRRPSDEQLFYLPEEHLSADDREQHELWRPSTVYHVPRLGVLERIKNYFGSKYYNWQENRQRAFNERLRKLRHNTAGRTEQELLEQWR